MNARTLSGLLAALLCLLAVPARADREKAAAAYKEGAEQFAKGAFAEAAASFDAAFAEDPRGASAYNAALSWQSAHDDPRAADDFARAIGAGDLAEPLVANAKNQLATLEASLGRIAVAGPPGARYAFAHASGAPPAVVHVAPGHYVVHATFDGGTSGDFPVDATAGAEQRVDLVAPKIVVAAKPAPVEVIRRGGVLGPATLPLGVAFVGAGAVAGGFAIGLGVATLDALDAYKKTGYTSQSAHDHASALRDWTNVAFGSALALGALGIALLVTVHRVRVQAALGPGSLSLRGTF